MGKPPEGGGSLLTIASCIFAICVIPTRAQISQEYGCPSQEKILPCRCSTRGMEFQIWCSHSELPNVLQGLNAVSHYVTRPIDELILENNNLPSLPGKVFTSLRVLRLMLRNNRLERVSASWLEGLHDSLLELFVVEPDLRSLPVDSLENLQGLEAITLQSKSMKRLPRFTGLSKLRYLQVNSPSLMELSPMNFRHLPSLDQLHVFGSPRLSRLEAGILRNLPRLSIVNISDSGISWIHPRAMIDLPELREISLKNNEILDASIVGRSIVDLPSLSVVNLDGNRISHLAESSFVDNPSISRLSLARNFITEVSSGAFQRLTNLRVLDLSHNRLRRVSPEFFLQRTGNSRLEEIWLIDNELRHYNELRAILEALPGLKFIDMSQNLLEEIPYGALRGHPTLERLHLDHNRLNFLQRDSFVAMPALRELRLRNNSLTNLLEAPFWNLPGLKGLDLSENYFRHVEPRLLGNLPNLRRLDLSGNGIAHVEASSFMGTTALEHLNISGNALSTIHPMTFGHLTSLYELDVGWNRLIGIVPGLPINIEHLHLPMNRIVKLPSLESRDLALTSLRSLDVSANGIERIPPGALGELSSLRKLNLGYNALRILEDGTFEGLTRLEQLDIRYNRLVTLHGRCLKPLINLMDLNIRGNRLEVMRPDLFQENSQLQRLDVSRNNLAQIPHATFSNTRDLRELYASHNSLTELPVSLHGLTALEVLDLSFNRLNILSPETLSSLTSLLELRLVRNRIKELREGAFDRLPRLTFIDLENNDLRVIERNAIRSLPELQALRLGKNRLRSIPSGAFSELPLLQSAELQENRIHEIATNAFVNVPHLLFLNLSNNQLPEIGYVGLESLRSLEVLDLSNNRLSRVSSDSLASMEWLVELKMDNNRICSVQGSPFDEMPRLRVLSLRSNRMTTVTEKAFKRLRSNIAVLDIDGNPLSCSCGMLWLRGWLQQASTDGPRCADGSLFKEIRLSRQDCQRTRQIEPIYPGCEAEIIDQSSSSLMSSTRDSGDSLPGWTNLRDPPRRDHQTSQNLDYQTYDDNANDNLEITSEAEGSLTAEVTTSEMPLATSHVTPPPQSSSSEVTPPLIQTNPLTNNRPVSEKIPSRDKNTAVPPSPSSSGFTFFGVPLPSINFNLWGNTGSRKQARRKEDVASETNARPGRSRYRVFPPTEPEIHRGGFVPLPQGQGGFVPIPDPRFSHERRVPGANDTGIGTSFERTATVTRVYAVPVRRKSEKIASNVGTKLRISSLGKLGIKEREELTTSRNDPAALSSAMNSRRVPSNRTSIRSKGQKVSEIQREGEKIKPVSVEISTLSSQQTFLPTEQSSVVPLEISSLSAEHSSLSTDLRESHVIEPSVTIPDDEVTNGVVWTSPSSLETGRRKNLTEPNFTDSGDSARTKKIGIWDVESRLPPGKHISAENLDNDEDFSTTSGDYRASVGHESEKKSSVTSPSGEILEASALSALLIPGGQVSASSSSKPPSGRSTIVKIASPHLSLTTDRDDLVDNSTDRDDLVDNSTDRDYTIERESEKVTRTGVSLNEGVRIIEDNPFNWYFQNYNESNIEPYVAVVYSNAETTFVSRLVIVILPFFLAVRA